MNQQDRYAADQLDLYIDASRRGRRGEAEFPFVDQLLALAESIEAKPTLKERLTLAEHNKPVAHRPIRWAGAAALIAVALLMFMTVPALRTFAHDILRVFAVQETDRDPSLQPTAAPPAGENPVDIQHPNPSHGLTLEQVRAEVAASDDITFDVATPSHLPTGFGFDAGIVDEFGRMVILTYVSADRLSTFHVNMYDLANPNPAVEVALPVGATSHVEEITIGGQAGEYVQGAYDADGTWDAEAPVQTLAWATRDVQYVLTTHEQNVELSRASLIAIAESIAP